MLVALSIILSSMGTDAPSFFCLESDSKVTEVAQDMQPCLFVMNKNDSMQVRGAGLALPALVMALFAAPMSACDDTTPEERDVLRKVGEPDPDPILAHVPDKFRRTHLNIDGKGKTEAEAQIEEVKDGVRIKVEVDDAPPGKYSVVVHSSGNCSESADALGPPFQLTRQDLKEGEPPPPLGEIEVDENDHDGTGLWLTTRGNLRDDGDATLLGKPIAVYFPPKEGKRGELMACGMIHL